MKRIILLLITGVFAVMTFSIKAQTWSPIGNGIPENLAFANDHVLSTSDGGDIYVLTSSYNNVSQVYTVKVYRWDGLSWAVFPTTTSLYSPEDIAVYNGAIYVAFAFDGYKIFDGVSWGSPGFTSIAGSVQSLEVINGELYVGGSFTVTVGGQTYEKLFKYDGSNYIAYPALPSDFGIVRDILETNGDLYLSGKVISTSNYPAGLVKYDGVQWEFPAAHLQGTGTINKALEQKIFTHQGTIYVHNTHDDHNPSIYSLGNDTLHVIAQSSHAICDYLELGGNTYLVGDSAALSTSPHISMFDGNMVSAVFNGPRVLRGIEVLGSEMYVFSLTQKTMNGVSFNHAFKSTPNFSVLNGQAYYDLNNDCFKNTTEYILSGVLVSLNNQQTVVADLGGTYSIALAAGTYSFNVVTPSRAIMKNLVNSCALPGSITIGNNQTITQDIGFRNSVNTDGQIFITSSGGWTINQGFMNRCEIDVNNAGNATLASATVDIDVPQAFSVITTDPAPVSQTGNTWTFDVLNLQPFETRKIKVFGRVPPNSGTLGDTITWTTHLTNISGDTSLADNTDTLHQVIVAAVDPNDKQASSYSISPQTNTIDYHIRFQNTGNATAQKVVVVDSLDLTLPITHIVIKSASHPYSLSVQNNVLIWTFDNIMLPDSSTDYLGSQGFVRFSAGINPSLSIGDTIDNDAEIYFDYQQPVHTNHAKTVIVNNISLKEPVMTSGLQVYPNPGRNVIHIRNVSGNLQELSLINASGQNITRFRIESGTEYTYDVRALPAGIYMLRSANETYRVVLGQ